MKIISIILDHYLADWILGCSQKNNITISEFVRSVLYQKMQQGSIIIDHKNIFKQSKCYNQINRNEIKYIIFTAKLLERLVLATEEQGEILYNLALEETKSLLDQMHFNSKKSRFCISLEEGLFTWLSTEATRLQFKIVPLIRKLLEDVFEKNQISETIEFPQISSFHKISLKYQIMTYILLEKLVNYTVDGAEAIIQNAQTTAEDLLFKLRATSNKFIPN